MDLSLVFPCYNEEGHLERNVERLLRILKMLRLETEIVVVDDCSSDGTREIIEQLIRRHPGKVRAIFHEKNKGRGGAFMTGFEASTADYVGFFDVDFEIGPTYLLECLAALDSGADMVIGKRIYHLQFSQLHRHLLSSLYARAVVSLLRLPSGLDTESGYKFFRRGSLGAYVESFEHTGWFWDTEVVTRFFWDERKIVTVPVAFVRDPSAASTVRVVRDSIQYLRNILQFRRRHLARITRRTLPLPESPYPLFQTAPGSSPSAPQPF